MEKAKAAVSDFMSKSGKHDTTVHEKVAPAVTHETVNPTRHENVTTAVDKEIHQDHYHTSVQPVQDREVIPEKHTHNLAPVQHRELHHGKSDDVAARLQHEASQFTNKREVAQTKETKSISPVVGGEHIHHHVHETIQPVIHKETVQPHVVHTTVPIHETHHNSAQHHSASTMPTVHMSDFKKQGGVLAGRDVLTDSFAGEPKSMNALGTTHHKTRTGRRGSTSSLSSSDDEVKRSKRSTGHTSAVAHDTSVAGNGGTHKKPSLMDKLNPRVDADGDGKAGFLK